MHRCAGTPRLYLNTEFIGRSEHVQVIADGKYSDIEWKLKIFDVDLDDLPVFYRLPVCCVSRYHENKTPFTLTPNSMLFPVMLDSKRFPKTSSKFLAQGKYGSSEVVANTLRRCTETR